MASGCTPIIVLTKLRLEVKGLLADLGLQSKAPFPILHRLLPHLLLAVFLSLHRIVSPARLIIHIGLHSTFT